MNKMDKLVVLLLGLALVGWFWHDVNSKQKEARAAAEKNVAAVKSVPASKTAAPAAKSAAPATKSAASAQPAERAPAAPKVRAPERFAVLSNAQISVVLSTRGAVVKGATLFDYAEKPGAISADNPAYRLDFSAAPILALEGVAGVEPDGDWELVSSDATTARFRCAASTRTVTLERDYRLKVEETFAAPAVDAPNRLSLGCMNFGSSQTAAGASKNDILSIDSFVEGPKPEVEHHGETEPLKSYLVGSSGGCSGAPDASGRPAVETKDVPGARRWIAVKNRFFVTALVRSSEANTGFSATMRRDAARREFALKSVSADAQFASLPATRAFTFYVGPKKQSYLWDLGLRDVMEYGIWRWFCYPIVWLFNLFHDWAPNYGVAIILLTVLVRIVFWPLTHKSTVSMRRMSEMQPLMKEIRERCKDNPQKLQQETWKLYRDHKVNPMASCLPMLAQIPVFIALFTVLRSAVELRYAPFLWVADLSEPEALFADWFPFGGLNVLPILMAATMALQSALTPSTGDKAQQRMMMVMMPVMMLFMFYSFPSALSLYWTLSQVFSIVQMWWIRKKYTPAPAVDNGGVVMPDAVEMPVTRQMRRHGSGN